MWCLPSLRVLSTQPLRLYTEKTRQIGEGCEVFGSRPVFLQLFKIFLLDVPGRAPLCLPLRFHFCSMSGELGSRFNGSRHEVETGKKHGPRYEKACIFVSHRRSSAVYLRLAPRPCICLELIFAALSPLFPVFATVPETKTRMLLLAVCGPVPRTCLQTCASAYFQRLSANMYICIPMPA